MRQLIEIRPGRRISINIINETARKQGVIFLFHGSGGRGDQWRQQVSVLQADYCLIVPDMLGHGQSEKPVPDATYNPYSFTELMQDMQTIFERYAGNNNIIIGHSRGATLSTYLTMANQNRVKKLILITPSQSKVQHVAEIWNLPVEELEKRRLKMAQEFKTLFFAKETPSELIAVEAKAGSQNPMYVMKPMILGLKQLPEIDVSELLVPTLIIIAEEDRVTPLPKIKEFYGDIPNHKFITVRHAGHLVILEQSEIVNAIILRFLNNQSVK